MKNKITKIGFLKEDLYQLNTKNDNFYSNGMMAFERHCDDVIEKHSINKTKVMDKGSKFVCSFMDYRNWWDSCDGQIEGEYDTWADSHLENIKDVVSNIFLICPVRGISEEYKEKILKLVNNLEASGNSVHWPMRDTNQNDDTGFHICLDNMKAIESADEIYVIWDGKSQGVLFDLGMAFALGKKVVPVDGLFPEPTVGGKSFPSMVHKWKELEVLVSKNKKK